MLKKKLRKRERRRKRKRRGKNRFKRESNLLSPERKSIKNRRSKRNKRRIRKKRSRKNKRSRKVISREGVILGALLSQRGDQDLGTGEDDMIFRQYIKIGIMIFCLSDCGFCIDVV